MFGLKEEDEGVLSNGFIGHTIHLSLSPLLNTLEYTSVIKGPMSPLGVEGGISKLKIWMLLIYVCFHVLEVNFTGVICFVDSDS